MPVSPYLDVTSSALRSREASKYRPEIDGLRAFAVIAVIINHFNKDSLPSGYLGVDIFFVISGFVITSSLLGRESENLRDFLAGFYERRIKRLVPALVVFVLATSLLICLFNPEPETSIKTGITSLFGLSNIYLFKQSTDYFAESTGLNPFVHTWSLGVEEQFYLLFPFMIWISGFGRQTPRGARNLFWMVGILSIASAIGYVYLSQFNQPASYFLMPPRFWELSAGCLVFLGLHKRAWIGHLLQKISSTFIAIVMIGVMFLPVSTAIPATFLIVILTGLLIGSLRPGTAVFRFLTLDKVVYIGLISYSLYLWHWGVLSIGNWTIGLNWWSTPLLLAVTFIFSDFSYRFIEKKLRFRTPWLGRYRLFLAGAISLLTACFTLAAFLASNSQLYLGKHGGQGADKDIESKDSKECDSNTYKLLFIGDSHAGHFQLAKTHACNSYNLNIKVLSKGGTPFPTVYFSNAFHGASKEESIQSAIKLENKWNSEKIPNAEQGAVILTNRSLVYFDHAHSDDHPNSNLIRYSRFNPKKIITERVFLEEWKRSIESLLRKYPDTTFIYALPNPEFRSLSTVATLCKIEWFRPFPPESCFKPGKRNEQIAKHAYFKSAIKELSRRNKNLFVFDYFDEICPPEKEYCTIMTDKNTPMYRDGDHFTEIGATKIFDRLVVFLAQNKLISKKHLNN